MGGRGSWADPEAALYRGCTINEYPGTHEQRKLAIPQKQSSSDFVEGIKIRNGDGQSGLK